MNSNGFVYFLIESHASSPYSSIWALILHKYMFSVWDTNSEVEFDEVISNNGCACDEEDAIPPSSSTDVGIFKLCNRGNS
jgi:hypothetical protein